MNDNQDKLNELLKKLDALTERQDNFSREITSLKNEIYKIKHSESIDSIEEEVEIDNNPVIESDFEIKSEEQLTLSQIPQKEDTKQQPQFSESQEEKPSEVKRSLESFIGENLINKIGIAITVIGVAIGAKYSIENELISPLTRIILGYLTGIGLLGIGFKLKEKYEGYSAVLVSGAIAIMYLITFSAYSFYELIPQTVTFLLMVVFTAFAVVAAINYNRQVIAHIGLVGAYAIPFLLSTGSGKVEVLFSYMALINIGILIISFKKYWKGLFYSSFGFTWVIFFLWFATKYYEADYFGLAFAFLVVFFVIFYLTFLAYKVIRKAKFEVSDILLLFANSFIFYGIGYMILEGNDTGRQLLGLFTVFNGLIHFIVSVVIFRYKLVDKNLFYLVSGLVLVFITIAVPVQLDGSWVTLLWVGEAALLFWIGRTKNVPVYEKLSYPLMLLAFLSLLQDWEMPQLIMESTIARFTPLFNINFISSLLFIAAFGFIYYLNKNKNYNSAFNQNNGLYTLVSYAIPAVLLYVCFNTFRMEIQLYWNQVYIDSAIVVNENDGGYSNTYRNFDLHWIKSIWLINYSLLFFAILSFLNLKKLKNQQLGYVNLILNTLAISVFLIQGLYLISELRESYLENSSEYFNSGTFNIVIRYISIGFYVLILFANYKYAYSGFLKRNFKIGFDYLLHASVLWIASSELIHWLDIAQAAQSYKLGLSILWGVYALFLIVLGIWKSKQHLRIGAFSLFGVTLIKLFFYDISHLNTISKTVVFVSLGILLLIISFLYNKYKHLISDENNS